MTRSSPNRRTCLVDLSSNSVAAAIGCQYRRNNSPIGVPFPTWVILRLSSTLSIVASPSSPPVPHHDFVSRRAPNDVHLRVSGGKKQGTVARVSHLNRRVSRASRSASRG